MPILRLPPEFLDCFVCRSKVDVKDPYPQLCPAHMADMGKSLSIVREMVDALHDDFVKAMRAEFDERMTAVLVAASDLELPGIHYVKTKKMTEFMRRLEATVAKGDDFAVVVATWWNARQATVDAEKLALQMAWAPIGVEARRDRQS